MFLQSCFNLKVKQLCPVSPPDGANRKANILLSCYCRNVKRICKVSVCIHHLQQYKAWRDQRRFGWWMKMCSWSMIHLWNWNSFSFEQTVRIHFVSSFWEAWWVVLRLSQCPLIEKYAVHRLNSQSIDFQTGIHVSLARMLGYQTYSKWLWTCELVGARMCDLQRYMNHYESLRTISCLWDVL